MNQTTLRRGISLLEILVSLFIILVGLLGVAALLPVGKYDLMVASMADRGAACARAAMRDVVVRGMLDQTQWIATGIVPATLPDAAVAIDPIGVSQGLPLGFPFNDCFSPNAIQMYRVTLPVFANPGVAQRVFRWRDDLQFDISGERTERPRQVFRLDNGEVGFGPATTAAEKTSNPLLKGPEQVAETQDPYYSWMATVVPDLHEFGLLPPRRRYTVSVVVFYNRAVSADRELACVISPLGGGDGWLYVPDSLPQASKIPIREKLMALKQGDWILLRGLRYVQLDPPPAPPVALSDFKWYRVAALGDFDPARDAANGYDGRRLVTLAGPDWDQRFLPANGGATEVGLFDRVVGVYTQTVEVDR